MLKESVELCAAGRAPLPGRLADDIIGILAAELVGHHAPESVQRVASVCFVGVGGCQKGAIKDRYTGLQVRVWVQAGLFQDAANLLLGRGDQGIAAVY